MTKIFSQTTKRKKAFGKKGNAIADSLLVLIFLGMFIYVLIMGKSMISDIASEITEEKGWSSNTSKIVSDLDSDYGSLWDGIFIFIFIGLWIAALTFAFFLDTNPIFMILTVVAMASVLLVAGELANTYDEFVSNDANMESIATSSFPMANALLDNWLIAAIVVGFSILVVLYSKRQMGS